MVAGPRIHHEVLGLMDRASNIVVFSTNVDRKTALVCTDATPKKADENFGFNLAIWLDGSNDHVGSMEGPNVASPKEAEMRAMLIWAYKLLSHSLEIQFSGP